MKIDCLNLPRYIDISAVRTDCTHQEVMEVARIAKKYNFICAFAMPCFTKMLGEELKGSRVMLGGTAGFPSGADCTEEKVSCAKRMLGFGCNEIDMVINVGALKSGDYDYVRNDIRSVVEAVYPTPVKSILEIAYLTDDQITKACKLAVDAGVTFVKSGTGWAGKPTTVETVKIMKAAVGDRAKVKAAGGIRSLSVLEEMMDEGCVRFGIGIKSVLNILKEAYARDGLPFEESINLF